MMGDRLVTQESLFYQFRLEDRIPADHMLRAIDRFVDLDGLQATYTGRLRAGIIRVAGCATPTGSAGHAGVPSKYFSGHCLNVNIQPTQSCKQ